MKDFFERVSNLQIIFLIAFTIVFILFIDLNRKIDEITKIVLGAISFIFTFIWFVYNSKEKIKQFYKYLVMLIIISGISFVLIALFHQNYNHFYYDVFKFDMIGYEKIDDNSIEIIEVHTRKPAESYYRDWIGFTAKNKNADFEVISYIIEIQWFIDGQLILTTNHKYSTALPPLTKRKLTIDIPNNYYFEDLIDGEQYNYNAKVSRVYGKKVNDTE